MLLVMAFASANARRRPAPGIRNYDIGFGAGVEDMHLRNEMQSFSRIFFRGISRVQ
jgi:hypothetical protein